MDQPINLQFVTTKTIQTVEDGESKTLTVLVLDTEANSAYWKFVHSFPEFLHTLELTDASQVKGWYISSSFAEKPHYRDVAEQLLENDVIFGFPVTYMEDKRPWCVIELSDGKLKEHELWK